MDSLTDTDIDRIFIRIQKDIDLSKITSKSQFQNSVSSNSKTRNWNRKINDFYWDRIGDERNEFIKEVNKSEDFEELNRIKRGASKVIDEETLSLADQKMQKISQELAQLTEERKEKRLEEEKEQKRLDAILKREADIQRDIDNIEDLSDVDNIKRRIKKLPEFSPELEFRVEEIRIGLEEQREADRLEKIRIQQARQEEVKREKQRLRDEENIETALTGRKLR